MACEWLNRTRGSDRSSPDGTRRPRRLRHRASIASIYGSGMVGGEAGDRVGGLRRALVLTPLAEPDHLAALLGLFSALAADAPARAARPYEPPRPIADLWRERVERRAGCLVAALNAFESRCGCGCGRASDLVAGFSVVFVAVPQSLAYAETGRATARAWPLLAPPPAQAGAGCLPPARA
jgi:hypothetical protein